MIIVSEKFVCKHRYDGSYDVYDKFWACDHIEYFEEASSALLRQIDVARHDGFGYCAMASANVERSLMSIVKRRKKIWLC